MINPYVHSEYFPNFKEHNYKMDNFKKHSEQLLKYRILNEGDEKAKKQTKK